MTLTRTLAAALAVAALGAPVAQAAPVDMRGFAAQAQRGKPPVRPIAPQWPATRNLLHELPPGWQPSVPAPYPTPVAPVLPVPGAADGSGAAIPQQPSSDATPTAMGGGDPVDSRVLGIVAAGVLLVMSGVVLVHGRRRQRFGT